LPKSPKSKKLIAFLSNTYEGITIMNRETHGTRGGQMRTYLCHCGWQCRKQLQEANKLYKLHQRVSHKEEVGPPAAFEAHQGRDGFTQTKNGNIVQKPLEATITITDKAIK
jgi:hypothetical protein